jgi:RNA polymerase sigma-70 factor, ECF subfamily
MNLSFGNHKVIQRAGKDPPDSSESSSGQHWVGLVEKVRRNDPEGMEELYRCFARGVRFYLRRQLGQKALDERVENVFLAVAQAIQDGELHEPARLVEYVRTIVRRQVATEVDGNDRPQFDLDQGRLVQGNGNNPEQVAIPYENQQSAVGVLKGIGQRDREILIRFYLWAQTADQICSEMGLTDAQFRLVKSRAKTRFASGGNGFTRAR